MSYGNNYETKPKKSVERSVYLFSSVEGVHKGPEESWNNKQRGGRAYLRLIVSESGDLQLHIHSYSSPLVFLHLNPVYMTNSFPHW